MPKASVLDKMFREIAPGYARSRLESKHVFDVLAASSYEATDGGRRRNLKAWNRAGGGSEEVAANLYDRLTMMYECMDLYRNNEIVCGVAKRFPSYAVWKGIYPVSTTKSKDWNKLADDWWRDIYSPTADFRQRPGVDLPHFQNLIIKNRILMGATGFILMKNGQVQPVEPDRIRTPSKMARDESIRDGIKLSKNGIVLGYYICDHNSRGNIDITKHTYVPRENFIYCSSPWRIAQLHGVPEIHAAISKFRDLDETDEAMLNKVKIESMQTLKRTKEGGVGGLNDSPRGSYTKSDSSNNTQTVVKHETGQLWELNKGEDIASVETRTPHSEHVPYMEYQLRLLAACLEIPYEYLMLIFTSGSFSAQRAAMLHANHAFEQWHKWVIDHCLKRLRNWRIAKAIKDGTLPMAPVDDQGVSEWWKCDWTIPYFGWVDPEKQVKADKERWNMGSTSMSSIISSQGRQRDTVFNEKQDDIEAAIDRSNQVNKKYPNANTTWRDFISTTSPGQVTREQAMAGSVKEDDEDDEDQNKDDE